MNSFSDLRRVAILGATGWVGRTALKLLRDSDSQVMLFASRSRTEELIGARQVVHEVNLSKLREFKPELVLDAAFLTRDKLAEMSVENYIRANSSIINLSLDIQQLPSVRQFIGFSSGASLGVPDLSSKKSENEDPYGSLKRHYEDALLSNSRLSDKTKIARIWSVSGPLVTKPHLFAFSQFIRQALEGEVVIEAAHKVWRRYVDLEDFIRVAISASLDSSRVLDSGGDLLELRELAEKVFWTLDLPVKISRNEEENSIPDEYYSSNYGWNQALVETGFVPKTIEEQIRQVHQALQLR
jgi:nucleoside-diphosphate-sugar epimerase